jgi:Phytanoyl-CoA dioxygenase (PhyH)
MASATPNGPLVSGPLTAHERYDFDRNGFVVRRGALDRDTTNELLALLHAQGYPDPGPSIPSQRFHGFLRADARFRELLDHDAVREPLIELCGAELRLDHCYGIAMAPGTGGLGLHGGGTPHDPAQYYRVHDGQMFNGLVAVQWALVDHAPGEGGFCCIPGSHRANFALPEPADPSWVVEIALHAGDVLFFTEALTHGTSTWTAPHIRYSLFYKYAPGHLAWGREYEKEFHAPELRDLLTARQRLLLQSPAVWPFTSITDAAITDAAITDATAQKDTDRG